MEQIREVTYWAVALRVALAAIMGGLLGLERGLKNRPAGLRTYMMVCTGACLVMLTNQYIFQVYQTGDPVRMGAQVVSGIGFLGAGTIIVTRHSQIKGLTTAAGLWTAAGVGLALGVGFYEAALAGGIASFIVMTLLQRMDEKMHRRTKRMDVYVELEKGFVLGEFLKIVREKGMETHNVAKEKHGEDSRNYTMTLRSPVRRSHTEILEELIQIPGVGWIEEL